MWQKLPAFIREWSILIVGILLIVPFFYLASDEADIPRKGIAPKGNIAPVITKPTIASCCGSCCATLLKRDVDRSLALASTAATTANSVSEN